MWVEVVLYLAVLATAYPVGLLLAWLCDDELEKDRKYMLITIEFIIVFAIILVVVNFKLSNLMSLIYLVIVFAVMTLKGYLSERKYRNLI